ncbi:uncharacterized protein LOC119958579 isoform X1 [Scyliorhinus canicula]|uniref:uncharacterized protein LOC119958579 isoform X1 n=1 Tax=Scyliorhinus canicula TaxID=7830 RepID=UPI0018F629C3|nr:uncharacterized protein LOC119958579 isoform X1 [Scyliorhinus canicula]
MINLALLWGIINLHVVVVKEIDADISVPTLSVTPEFKVFLTGEDIHLTCRCQCPIWRIHSCRNRKLIRNLYRDVNEGECENTIEFVAAPILEGNYTCQCLILEFAKWRFSNQSDPIPIQIRDKPPAPQIVKEPSSIVGSTGMKINIKCHREFNSTRGTFYLHRNKEGAAIQSLDFSGATQTVTFTVDNHPEPLYEAYVCRYKTDILGRMIYSPFSKDFKMTEQGHNRTTVLVHTVFSLLLFLIMVIILIDHFCECQPAGRD